MPSIRRDPSINKEQAMPLISENVAAIADMLVKNWQRTTAGDSLALTQAEINVILPKLVESLESSIVEHVPTSEAMKLSGSLIADHTTNEPDWRDIELIQGNLRTFRTMRSIYRWQRSRNEPEIAQVVMDTTYSSDDGVKGKESVVSGGREVEPSVLKEKAKEKDHSVIDMGLELDISFRGGTDSLWTIGWKLLMGCFGKGETRETEDEWEANKTGSLKWYHQSEKQRLEMYNPMADLLV